MTIRKIQREHLLLIFVAVLIGLVVFALQNQKTSLTVHHKELNGFRLDSRKPHVATLSDIIAINSKDRPAAITEPRFSAANNAGLQPHDQGLLLEINGEQRFYPAAILNLHHMINDTIGALSVVITINSQTESVEAFDRSHEGKTLYFGNSGLALQNQPLIYDDATHSLWLAANGQSIIGDLSGTQLKRIQGKNIDFQTLKAQYSLAMVLLQPSQ